MLSLFMASLKSATFFLVGRNFPLCMAAEQCVLDQLWYTANQRLINFKTEKFYEKIIIKFRSGIHWSCLVESKIKSCMFQKY